MESKGKLNILNVSKRYEIGEEKNTSLRASLKRPFSFKKKEKNTFWALKNISIKIDPGEVVGIIGKNGAGKSTLLKVLSKITAPTEGRIEINGRVASLLEVGTGFHPELTGRENIYLNGTILGMTKKEVKEKFDEIIEFSGIGKFIDTPVKKYSSGMYVRLAFSVAAHLEPEILVIDEVLAVGDAEFQNKCLGKMQDVASTGRTVLFVSHNLAAVKKLCTKGVLLEKGEVKIQGEINDVIQEYIKSGESSHVYKPEVVKSNIPVAFRSIELLNSNQQHSTDFTCEEEIIIKFHFALNKSPQPYSVFVIVKDKYDSPVFSAEHKIVSEMITLSLEKRFLTRGRYQIHSFIHIPKVEQIDVAKDVCGFTITDATSHLAIHGNYEYGNVFGNYKWIEA